MTVPSLIRGTVLGRSAFRPRRRSTIQRAGLLSSPTALRAAAPSRRNDHALVHAGAVRIDGHLRRALRLARPWLIGWQITKPPALEARMLPGRDHVAFDAGEQHGSVNPQVVHHHAAADAGEGARVGDAFAGGGGDGEAQITFAAEAEAGEARAVLDEERRVQRPAPWRSCVSTSCEWMMAECL